MKARHNKFEELIRECIKTNVHIELCFEQYNTSSIIEMRKNANNKNKLFQDACSPYRTDYGNERTTEFVLHCPKHKINWRVEGKSQKKGGNLILRAYEELEYVSKLKEDMFVLVLGGAFNTPKIYQKINDVINHLGLKGKVWYGDLQMFNSLLKKQMRG
jgi:hypothetical protein